MRIDRTPRYVADDGTEFKDQDECLEYEQFCLVLQAFKSIDTSWDQLSFEDLARVVVERFVITPRNPDARAGP